MSPFLISTKSQEACEAGLEEAIIPLQYEKKEADKMLIREGFELSLLTLGSFDQDSMGSVDSLFEGR